MAKDKLFKNCFKKIAQIEQGVILNGEHPYFQNISKVAF